METERKPVITCEYEQSKLHSISQSLEHDILLVRTWQERARESKQEREMERAKESKQERASEIERSIERERESKEKKEQ